MRNASPALACHWHSGTARPTGNASERHALLLARLCSCELRLNMSGRCLFAVREAWSGCCCRASVKQATPKAVYSDIGLFYVAQESADSLSGHRGRVNLRQPGIGRPPDTNLLERALGGVNATRQGCVDRGSRTGPEQRFRDGSVAGDGRNTKLLASVAMSSRRATSTSREARFRQPGKPTHCVNLAATWDLSSWPLRRLFSGDA